LRGKRKSDIARSDPIVLIGSAIGDFDGCFTCITVEGDDSGDYEIY